MANNLGNLYGEFVVPRSKLPLPYLLSKRCRKQVIDFCREHGFSFTRIRPGEDISEKHDLPGSTVCYVTEKDCYVVWRNHTLGQVKLSLAAAQLAFAPRTIFLNHDYLFEGIDEMYNFGIDYGMWSQSVMQTMMQQTAIVREMFDNKVLSNIEARIGAKYARSVGPSNPGDKTG